MADVWPAAPRSRLMDELDVSVEIRQGCRVVTVAGDLDADTAPNLEFELDRLLGGLPVVIDLSQVRFLTSAGIVALLSERTFGRPALSTPDSSHAAKMLEIVRAQRLVPIYRDLDDAIRAASAAA
jgi:anti-anti-sigma factor